MPDLTHSDPEPLPSRLEPLRLQLQEAVDGYWSKATYAIAVTDLQTGETVGVNEGRPQVSGCVLNLFVILSAVLDVQEGLYGLEVVDSLIRQTLWASNAITAHELYAITADGEGVVEGVAKVAALMQRLGMTSSIADHPPAYPGETRGVDERNWVTAADVNRALAQLWRGHLLDEEHRAYLLEAMTRVKPGLNYLVAATPGEATVSHKNGYLVEYGGWVDNDTGIVRFTRDGQEYAYAVTFLAMDLEGPYSDVPLGQQLVKLAWEHLSAQYQ
ncbi:MAG: serine hydrolase [Dehalococcoidia bacterium]